MPTIQSGLFRCIPPWDLIVQVFELLQLPTEFPAHFQRTEICSEKSDSIVALLEPYYKPAKAKQYLEYTDQKRWCTILRQLLAPYGWSLISREQTREKKKITVYSVELGDGCSALSAPVQVEFT